MCAVSKYVPYVYKKKHFLLKKSLRSVFAFDIEIFLRKLRKFFGDNLAEINFVEFLTFRFNSGNISSRYTKQY